MWLMLGRSLTSDATISGNSYAGTELYPGELIERLHALEARDAVTWRRCETVEITARGSTTA